MKRKQKFYSRWCSPYTETPPCSGYYFINQGPSQIYYNKKANIWSEFANDIPCETPDSFLHNGPMPELEQENWRKVYNSTFIEWGTLGNIPDDTRRQIIFKAAYKATLKMVVKELAKLKIDDSYAYLVKKGFEDAKTAGIKSINELS